MHNKLKYSIIVPVYKHNVEHIIRESKNEADAEIILIPTGNLKIESVYDNMRIIEAPGAGYAEAVNIGAENAHGEVLIIMNDDVYFEQDIFREYADLERKVYVPCVKDYSTGNIESCGSSADFIFRINHHRKTFLTECMITGSFFIISRAVFINSGGFDSDYQMYYEDADLSKRLNSKRISISPILDLVVKHEHSFSNIGRKRYYIQRNRILYAIRHTDNIPLTCLLLIITDFPAMFVQAIINTDLTPFYARFDAVSRIRKFYRKRNESTD